jgi:hypothetical protein
VLSQLAIRANPDLFAYMNEFGGDSEDADENNTLFTLDIDLSSQHWWSDSLLGWAANFICVSRWHFFAHKGVTRDIRSGVPPKVTTPRPLLERGGDRMIDAAT